MRSAGEIEPHDIQQYLRIRVEQEGIHKAAANKELTTLRSVFSFARRREYVGGNPARMVDRFSLDADDKEQLPEPVYIPGETYDELLNSEAAPHGQADLRADPQGGVRRGLHPSDGGCA